MKRHDLKGVLVNHLKDRSFRLVHWLNIIQYPLKDQSRIHQFGKKVLPGIFLGCALHAGGIWKGDMLVADLEELEEINASDIYARRLNAKEVMMPKSGDEFIVAVKDGTVKPLGGDQALKSSTLRRNWPIRGEGHHDFLGESEGWSPPAQHFQDSYPDAVEARNDFWSISGDFKNRQHVEPRGKLYTPEEKNHFLFHQCYSCNLGCRHAGKPHRWSLEHRWIQRFVWFMDRFHTSYLIERKASRRIHVVRWQIDQTASDIKAWSFVARNLEKCVKKLQDKRRKIWATQNPSWRTPEDFGVFTSLNLTMRKIQEIIKNARKMLEVPAAPTMLW